ncbi:hypothetical protein EYF80_027275 [Liparis tanakae]|uniref:Uncharacterized protein n=1 Tax=Liparis tanakae TaxID=230148 RepID=A0A4Z2HCH3_9TELE|nr:hypothetical protein EYF80_027275 [Liparis tanakae]
MEETEIQSVYSNSRPSVAPSRQPATDALPFRADAPLLTPQLLAPFLKPHPSSNRAFVVLDGTHTGRAPCPRPARRAESPAAARRQTLKNLSESTKTVGLCQSLWQGASQEASPKLRAPTPPPHPLSRGSRLWNQRRCKCCTPRLWEAGQCRPALAPPADPGCTAAAAAHLERALTPRPAQALRTVGGAARASRGGRLARLGWATLTLERCSSRMLPAIR